MTRWLVRRNRDLGSVYADVNAALAGIEFPHGYYPELLAEYTERLIAQRRMLIAALIAGVGIFLLLQASMGSTRLAVLAILASPTALIGGIPAALA